MIISSLAETTGGSAVFAPGADSSGAASERIAEDLRTSTCSRYPSDDKKHDGKMARDQGGRRSPRRDADQPEGYFAPSDLPPAAGGTAERLRGLSHRGP